MANITRMHRQLRHVAYGKPRLLYDA